MKTDPAELLKKAGDLSLKGEGIVDVCAIVCAGANAAGVGGAAILIPSLGIPFAAAGLTVAGMAAAAGRLYHVRGKTGDTQETKSLKSQFTKAAAGYFAKQAASVALMAISFVAYTNHLGSVLALGRGEGALWTGIASGIAAAGLGLWARVSNRKMNACDAALRTAQPKPPAPPVPAA